MIINSIEELRLAAPAHAYDSIDGLVGFIDNSEHDFLEDKLGTPLYESLCRWYNDNPVVRSTIADYSTGYYNRLLLLCQRVVAFDALGRSAGMQGVSANNAGLNQMTADGYKAADKDSIDTYRQTCQREAHTALNQLLRQLEQWTKTLPQPLSDSEGSGITDGGVQGNDAPPSQGGDRGGSELQEIVTLWHQSSYYYLAAALLIPSCQVMQQYLNIYDSREKFIQLLPDLQFIQEEQIAPTIGEPLMLAIIAFARDGVVPDATVVDGSPIDAANSPMPAGAASLDPGSLHSDITAKIPANSQPLPQLLHKLRKVMAALLVGRTSVIKYTKEEKIQAHDDGVRMLQNVVDFLRQHQHDFPEALVKDAPWYVAPTPAPDAPPVPDGKAATVPCGSPQGKNDSAACWTPPLF